MMNPNEDVESTQSTPSEGIVIATSAAAEDPTLIAGDLPMVGEKKEMILLQQEQKSSTKTRSIFIIIFLIIVIALGVGLGVGLGGGNNNETTEASSGAGGPTNAPTTLAFAAKLQDVKDFAINNGISKASDFQSETSPQSLAAQFMAADDELVPLTFNEPGSYNFIERYALSVFYYATGGPTWNFASGFLRLRFDTCTWNSRGFVPGTSLGALCSPENRVFALSFPTANLQGTLPAEIGFLTDLVFFDVRDNRMSGSIPDSYQSLTQLTRLYLHYNAFTGSIPSWVGEYTALSDLALSNNMFEGSLPDSLATFTALDNLALDDNLFTGPIAQLSSLQSVLGLYLEDNQFTGTVDDNFLVSLSDVIDFDASDNKLVGTVPAHFFDPTVHPSLQILDLHGNSLNGMLPNPIPANGVLRFVALQFNEISGQIPDSMNNLGNLTHLDLTSNLFSGPIPEYSTFPLSLTYLFLADNPFTPGEIPASYQVSAILRDFSLKNTRRTGTIPAWFANMTNMILLDLDSNSLNGTLPAELVGMPSLSFLLLNRNELTGPIPQAYQAFKDRLRLLLLEDNELTGDGSFICAEATDMLMTSDCGGGDQAEVTCTCCRYCCVDGVECHGSDFLASYDPLWERSYVRGTEYIFWDFNVTGRL